MKKLFDINVVCTSFECVKSTKGQINMIGFTGDCHCDFFDGKIISGGVDTQKFISGEPGTLSARYILDGTDKTGKSTRIFIENNGVCDKDGKVTTHPVIYTDNPDLAYLSEMYITGTVEGRDDKVTISFFA